ncbi:MAG: hypothetical protein DRP09_18290 [Candidatus Thorarchaeota archaeon]|nr:MAG: hypothetical protein DRP09_18290 [Candidatus Thorarchaeota archaeon]
MPFTAAQKINLPLDILPHFYMASVYFTTDSLADISGDGFVSAKDMSLLMYGWNRVGDDFANVYGQLSQAMMAQTNTGVATLHLSPSSGTYNVGQEFNVQIHIDTGGQSVDGADVVLRYDPCALEVQDITAGDTFSGHSQSTCPETGEIEISGSGQAPFNGSGTLGTVRFRVVAGNTPSGLQVQFRPANTTDSNIAETNTNNEILGSVGNAMFNLTGTPSRPSLSGTFTSPDGSYLTRMDNLVTLEVNDACGGVIAEAVDFDVYYDSAWHSLEVDRNRYDGWSAGWHTAGVTDQNVSLRAVVSDTNGNVTTFIQG